MKHTHLIQTHFPPHICKYVFYIAVALLVLLLADMIWDIYIISN